VLALISARALKSPSAKARLVEASSTIGRESFPAEAIPAITARPRATAAHVAVSLIISSIGA